MNRRDLLKISAAAGVSLGAFGLPSLAQAKQIASADGIEVLSVSDGNLRLPLSFIFPDVPEAELKALLDGNLVDGEFVEPGLNLTLMKNGDRTVLFDVGSGPTSDVRSCDVISERRLSGNCAATERTLEPCTQDGPPRFTCTRSAHAELTSDSAESDYNYFLF